MTVRLITATEDLPALETGWRRLAAAQAKPALWETVDWFRAWLSAPAKGATPFVLTVESAGELLALAPLMRRWRTVHGMPVRSLEGITTDFPNAPVLYAPDSPDAVAAIGDWLRKNRQEWDRLHIRHVDLSREAVARFRSAVGALPHYLETSNASPWIPVAGTFDAYFRGLSGNFRRTLKNKANRLAKRGTVSVRRYPGAAPLAEGMAAAMAVAEASWQGLQGTAISAPSQAPFYRDGATGFAERGMLALYLLYLEDRPIAFEYDLLYRSCLFSLKWGYHPDYGEFSPGALLKKAVLEEAFASDIREVDLLGSADFYKLRWTSDIRPYHDLTVHSGTPRLWLDYFLRARVAPLLRWGRNAGQRFRGGRGVPPGGASGEPKPGPRMMN